MMQKSLNSGADGRCSVYVIPVDLSTATKTRRSQQDPVEIPATETLEMLSAYICTVT